MWHIHSRVWSTGRPSQMCDIRAQSEHSSAKTKRRRSDVTCHFSFGAVITFRRITSQVDIIGSLLDHARRSGAPQRGLMINKKTIKVWSLETYCHAITVHLEEWADSVKRRLTFLSLCLHLVLGQCNSCSNTYRSLGLIWDYKYEKLQSHII